VYYSLTGAGADVWALLDAGLAAPEIVELLARGAEPAVVDAGVQALIAQLLGEGLIARADRPAGAAPALQGGPWVAPRLETFNDLQELLLLDPIHDVDERGWPRAKAEG
jgi:hypothetical protein